MIPAIVLWHVAGAQALVAALAILAIRFELGWYLREIFRAEGQLYLRRWAIRPHRPSGENGWRVYLHRFFLADDDGHHDHPWSWSFSIVLWGSYTEEVLGEFEYGSHGWMWRPAQTRRVRWFNWIPAGRYHRITELHGNVWTLFFTGPVHGRGWGFWIPGRGHVDFATRLAERHGTPAEGPPTKRSVAPPLLQS